MMPVGSHTKPSLLTRDFALIALMQTTFSFAWSTFLLLPKYLTVELGTDSATLGQLIAASGVVAVLAVPATGALIDRLGRKPLVLCGCAMVTVYAFGFTLVREVDAYLYLLQSLHGLCFALTFNAAGTLVADSAPPARLSEAMSWFGAANVMMNAVATWVGEIVADAHGWHATFVLAGCAGALSIVLATLLRTPTGDAPGDPVATGDAVAGADAAPWREASVMLIGGAAFATIFTFHQPLALERGITEVRPFFIGFSAAVMFSRIGLGGLPDRIGRRRTSTHALIVYALVLATVPLLTEFTLPLYGVAFGLAHGFFYPAMNALAVEGRTRSTRGKAMTLVNGGFQAGYTVGVLGLGYMAGLLGYTVTFACGAALALLAAAMVARPSPVTAAHTPGRTG